MSAGHLNDNKYIDMVNNAQTGNFISSQKFKDFIGDVREKINDNWDAFDAHKNDTSVHTTQAEKDKLAGIEPGAQVNQNAFSQVNDIQATNPTDTLNIVGGPGVAITTNPATKTLNITVTGEATPGPHATSHITGGTDVIPDAVPNGNSGLMSGADKAKLDKVVSDVGDMSTVPTTSKVVAGAITELFTSVSDGKTQIAAAITDKGVPTSPTDTFATMAANIGAIETGGPWFGDWSAYTPVYDWAGNMISVNPGVWTTFLDLSGTGFFKWCRIQGMSLDNVPKIRITIDGDQYEFDSTGSATRTHAINFEIPFKSSLKIEGYQNTGTLMSCEYLCFIQSGTPDPQTNTILAQSTRNQTSVSTASTSMVDVVNIQGRGFLNALRFFVFIPSGTTSSGFVIGDLFIDGVQKMTESTVYQLNSDAYKRTDFFGPIRFESSLRVRVRVNTASISALCLVEYSLD